MTIPYRNLPNQIRTKSIWIPIFALVKTWGLIAATLVFCALSHSAIVWIAAAILIGVLQYHLNILAHDGLHFNLFDNRNLNDFVTRWLLLSPQCAPLNTMRSNHMYHHKRLGFEDDLDKQYYDYSNKSTPFLFTFWFIKAFSGGMVLPLFLKILKRGKQGKDSSSASPAKKGSSNDILSIVVVQTILLFGIFFITGKWWAYIPLWLVPMFTMMVGLNSAQSCLEHINLDTNPTQQDRFYTFRSNKIESFFLSPYNMNYHAEHHNFMQVPYYRLPGLRQFLIQENFPLSIVPSYFHRFKIIVQNLPQHNQSSIKASVT